MFKKSNLKPFENKVWLSSPTMHGDELKYMQEAFETNWMSTIGENIDNVEEYTKKLIGCNSAIALSSGTAALHMCMKIAGIKRGDKVFCSDMTFSATVNPIIYEGGIPIFIDCEYETWNMCPKALQTAFKIYPDVKYVVVTHLYGIPSKLDEIKEICRKHNAILIEDAAESLGAKYKGIETGNFGDYNAISFNGNKIITGSSGGMFLTNDLDAEKIVRKWSTQSREPVDWYQHKNIGYNYRMSNVIAGVVRGQYNYLFDHIDQKKFIYEEYKEKLNNLPVKMNPYESEYSEPNFWLSCLTIDKNRLCKQVITDKDITYVSEKGKTCPKEILEALKTINAEGRHIWKPMHMQPVFKNYESIVGNGILDINNDESNCKDIFERGICLPSDNKMTKEEQEKIIDIIKMCFE